MRQMAFILCGSVTVCVCVGVVFVVVKITIIIKAYFALFPQDYSQGNNKVVSIARTLTQRYPIYICICLEGPRQVAPRKCLKPSQVSKPSCRSSSFRFRIDRTLFRSYTHFLSLSLSLLVAQSLARRVYDLRPLFRGT